MTETKKVSSDQLSSEPKISRAKDKYDKQNTYRMMMGRYKKAINNAFYFEAILISYAALEDRLRSILYYLGVTKSSVSRQIDHHRSKKLLRPIYTEAEGMIFRERVIQPKDYKNRAF